MNSFYININSQDVWGNREKWGKTEAKLLLKEEVLLWLTVYYSAGTVC